MVWESWYWKIRLKSLGSEIETLSNQPDASDLDTSNLEIAIFTGFFLIRKLIEAQTKLSLKTENQTVKCRIALKVQGAPLIDVMNRFDTQKLYDLESFSKANRALKDVCNIFMHSVFLWMVYDSDGLGDDEGIVTGVHLTSGYEKEKSIYWFEIADILKVFESVWCDELTELQMRRDPKTGELKVVRT